MSMDLDDRQVMHNASKIQAEAIAIVYRSFKNEGLPEELCHDLTMAQWHVLFNNPMAALNDAMERLNKALGQQGEEGGT